MNGAVTYKKISNKNVTGQYNAKLETVLFKALLTELL